jgi:SpoVK/Ycf46/Vps4 family AAA+-type ATPase
MIDSIVSPSLISVLLNNPNAVLILEDAEQAIMSRVENPNGASLVSNILNISDGIMGSILSVSLILTFNTERANIDKALLRKGRLQVEWEFKELGVIESKALAKKLGKDESKITETMKLCDIYNLDEVNFHKEKQEKKIGF